MDIDYLLALQSFRDATGGILNDFMVQISDFSYGIFIWLIACIFFWGVNKKVGSMLFLNVGLSRFLMQFLKLSFCIYRPYVRSSALTPIEEASGYSFPSGHSITATANYGTLAYNYRKNRGILAFFILMIALTAFSRNYIGVHTPQDVLVGILLGLVVVIFAPLLWNWIEKDSKRDYIVLIGGIVLTAGFLAYITLKSYPADYNEAGELIVDSAKMVKDGFKDAGRFFGLILGWFIERRFVRFSMEVSAQRRALRCLVGGLLLIAVEKLLTPSVAPLFGSNWGYFVMMAFELLVLIALYPLCFKLIEKHIPEKKESKKKKSSAVKA